MKIQSIILSGFLILNGLNVYAGQMSMDQSKDAAINSDSFYRKITPEFLYSYIDFDFDSSTLLSFNRFQGHSNLYALGADNIAYNNNTMIAGLYVFRIDTDVSSQVLLSPASPMNTYQTIGNNTIFGHVRRALDPQFAIDVSGGYGQNRVSSQTYVAPDTIDQYFSFTRHNNTNWFAGVNALFNKSWNKIMMNASAGILYSQLNDGDYPLFFEPFQPAQMIGSMRNEVTYLMENVELGYRYRSYLTPFINGGLVQVAGFSNNPATAFTVNGSLPQLNMNRSGYRVGGGITYAHKQFVLRLEQKYYNAADTFTSNQTIVGLEYHFS